MASQRTSASKSPQLNGRTHEAQMAVAKLDPTLGSDNALDGGLPRTQEGTTPQHLLMTLLGDYWIGRTEHLPSASLVKLLAEFDITEPSARAALNRLTKRGLLVSTKRGRNTYYGLSPHSVPLLDETLRRIISFGTEDARPWDGAWTMVAFSVPESHRQLRHSIRTSLRWLGFAALFDGLWCSPWPEQEEALDVLRSVGVDSATVMRAEVDERSTISPLSAWDLSDVRGRYLEFEAQFAPLLEDARRGALTASEALVARTNVMDNWRTFLGVEPDLPADLLPEDWPRARIRNLFLEIYDGLAPVAKARCQQIVAEHAPDLADRVTHHTTGETLANAR